MMNVVHTEQGNPIVGYEVVWATPSGDRRMLCLEYERAMLHAMQHKGVVYPLVRAE